MITVINNNKNKITMKKLLLIYLLCNLICINLQNNFFVYTIVLCLCIRKPKEYIL